MGRNAVPIAARAQRKGLGIGRQKPSGETGRPHGHDPFGTKRQSPSVKTSVKLFGPESTTPHIVDDLPILVAVSDRELEVIETYFGAALESLLGGTT
jgi:hypothetical protein